jgi:thiol:disulfide interchange protein
MRIFKALIILCLTLSCPSLCAADDPFASIPTVGEFLNFDQAYKLQASIDEKDVHFDWQIEPGYYLYHREFALELASEDKREAVELRIPPGLVKFDEVFQEERELYYEQVRVSATIPEHDGAVYLLHTVQGCADAGLCYPPETTVFRLEAGSISPATSADVPARPSAEPQSNSQANPAPIAAAEATPWIVISKIFAAFIGGIILNLMPCVFPVLSLKALSLCQHNGGAKERIVSGWAYTAGIAASFIPLAIVIILAKQAGESLGWGAQLQEPIFVALLIYLFFAIGLNFAGVFEISGRLMGVGQNLVQGSGTVASFFTGVLAAVVASPCTAPLMAGALGFALTQSIPVASLVFLGLALGMAFPFLLLSHVPSLAKMMPQPGAWMDVFKQVLSFPMFFTCAWLLLVLGALTSSDGSAYLFAGLTSLTLGLWLIRYFGGKGKIAAIVVSVLSLIAALYVAINIERLATRDMGGWIAYDPQVLSSLRSSGEPVFIDLTADWCITCKVNEKVALTEDVMAYAAENDITMMQGDWTKKDAEITALLDQFQRSGVPLYLMYPAKANAAPEILPQILTKGMVLEAMENAL